MKGKTLVNGEMMVAWVMESHGGHEKSSDPGLIQKLERQLPLLID